MAQHQPSYSKPRKSLVKESEPICFTEINSTFVPSEEKSHLHSTEMSSFPLVANEKSQAGTRDEGHFRGVFSPQENTAASKSNRCAMIAWIITTLLVVILLLALTVFCVFLWFEISELKSVTATSEQQNTSTSSAQFTTEALLRQLLQNFVDSR